MKIVYTDVLVIGGGLAGLRLAIGAKRRGHDALILSLVPAKRSHSKAAQGGMQAALGNVIKGQGDTEDVHFEDTVRGSDWGADQEVVRMFVNTAPKAVRELAAWGVPWSRVRKGDRDVIMNGQKVTITERDEAHGLIAQRDFGGTKKWRTCYAADGTGHSMINTVADQAIADSIPVHERKEALALIHDGSRCYGAVVRDLVTGEVSAYVATATAVCTGGAGRVYRTTTNAVICEGIGHALALETGVSALGNMEAVQFHPTGIFPAGILVTEGCRGDGGLLKDVDGHRFMPDYEPEKKELASRDVVSRRMEEHIKKGKGHKSRFGEHIWLDITQLGEKHIHTNLREVWDICHYFLGVDPVKEMIPVRPAQHYTMGGVRTDATGQSPTLKGLFSAGEAACWDMHGFNRLGGNSVAETVVAGMIVGETIADYCDSLANTPTVPHRAGARVRRARAGEARGVHQGRRHRGRLRDQGRDAGPHDRQGGHLPHRQGPRGGRGQAAEAARAQPPHRPAFARAGGQPGAGDRLPRPAHAQDRAHASPTAPRCAPRAAARTSAPTSRAATTPSGSSARSRPGRATRTRCRRSPTSRWTWRAWSCRRAGAATARRTTSTIRTPPSARRRWRPSGRSTRTIASRCRRRSCPTSTCCPRCLRGRNERIDERF